MELAIQKYLRSGKSPEDLKEELAIKFRSHKIYPNLLSFKYHQLDSPSGHPVVRESRGIILDSENNWAIVSYPFNRFFNSYSGLADKVDWASAKILEKYDGSLIHITRYKNQLNVAGSGSPDASGTIIGSNDPHVIHKNATEASETWNCNGQILPIPQTFAEYFWQVLNLYCSREKLEQIIPDNTTLIFEIMGPLNRIVIPCPQAKLVFLGARNLENNQELLVENVLQDSLKDLFPIPKSFDLQDMNDIIRSFDNMSGLHQEGYVVVDKNFNRIKIKNPGYCAIHSAKAKLSVNAFIEIARRGECTEIIQMFPEYKSIINSYRLRFESLINKVQEDYNKLKHIQNQKEFALAAKKTRCASALFTTRRNKCDSVKNYFMDIKINSLINLL
ncbi:MAG: RNA ligase [Bacteroidota bacterium]